MLGTNNKRWRARRGQSFLMMTFLIGAVMVALGVLFIALALSLSASVYALRAAAVAQALATAGIEDSMVQLARNGASAGTYGLVLNSGTANVTITQNAPSVGFVTALSVAAVGGVARKMQAVFSESTTTYQINLVSLQTLP